MCNESILIARTLAEEMVHAYDLSGAAMTMSHYRARCEVPHGSHIEANAGNDCDG